MSTAQLKLFLDSLVEHGDEAAGNPDAKAADRRLRDASGIDQKPEEPQTMPARQPPRRQPAPPHLRRIDNPIAVPPAQRACPKCGIERECYGHDVTEVIELIPGEVVVRVDKVEKLVCRPCEGELVRAPSDDKVVKGGKLAPGLVVQLIVDKYGLPIWCLCSWASRQCHSRRTCSRRTCSWRVATTVSRGPKARSSTS